MIGRDYHRFWFGVIALALTMEGVAIFRPGTEDTLSEWTWSKIHTAGMRAMVGALLVWLLWHFLFAGPRRGVGRVDLLFVLAGALIGLAAARWGWR